MYLEDVEPKFADGTDPIGSDTEGTAEEFPSEQQNEGRSPPLLKFVMLIF